MKHFQFILALILSLFGSLVFIASAQNYVPLAPLPIGEGSTPPPSYTMTTYLSGAIKLLLAIGASLAILMTVIGGTQYVAAGISPDAKSNAKDMITNAFIGLALMLLSYLILNSINPKLVQFDLSLKSYKAKVTVVPVAVVDPFSDTAQVATSQSVMDANEEIKNCPFYVPAGFSFALNSNEALLMESSGGTSELWEAKAVDTPPGVNETLGRLKIEVDKLRVALIKEGKTLKVNSAYRPYAYQKHLYDLYYVWVVKGLKDYVWSAGMPYCVKTKALFEAEYRGKHRLADTTTVANPDGGSAPHVFGRGVDLTLGIPDAEIKAFLSTNNIGLCWQALNGDPWHFNLKDSTRPCP